MSPDIPESALRFGFVSAPTGVHSGKTIQLPELSLLLDAAPDGATHRDFQRLSVDNNVLLKATLSGRRNAFRALAQHYSLRDDILLFRIFRFLWPQAEPEHPLLALLLASARDSALRFSAPVVLQKELGEIVTALEIQGVVATAYGNRYGPKTLRSMAQDLGGSWVQAGHLAGRSVKRRGKATAGPATVTYALLMGYLCGIRGIMLYETSWSRLLDLSREQIDAMAYKAAQRGWLSYRRIGDVAEITFPHLLAGLNEAEFTN